MKKSIILVLTLIQIVSASNGKHLYNKECSSCHGKHGDKKALGISKPIYGLKYKRTMKNMYEYANGKRKVSPMVKSVKKRFVKKHTKHDIESVAHYIESLKK